MKSRLVRIGAICDLINGRAFKPSEWSTEGLPIVRIQNLNSPTSKFNYYNGDVRERFLIDNGELLFAWSGTPGTSFGAHIWNGSKAVLNQHIFRVVFDRDRVEKLYLLFALNHKVGELIGKAHGGVGLQHVTKGVVEDTEILLPKLPEQRRIVDLLARAEGIVRLRREAASKAAELIPALFIHHFGDPATNPMGWPVRPLGDGLLAADYGCSTKAHAEGEGVPLIRMGNVTYAGDMDLSDLKFVHLDAAEQTKYELLEGDLLFNRTNSKELVGKTGLWSGQRDAVVASYFIRLRVDPQVFTPTYVWAFMNSKHMKKVLFETARGAIGQANINSKELKSFPVPTPPIEIQTALGERVVAVQSIVAQQTTALAKAQATFDALLAQAFAAH